MYRTRNTIVAAVCLTFAASAFAFDAASAHGMGHSGNNASNNHTNNVSFVTTVQPGILPPRMRNSPQTPPNNYVPPPFISVAGAGQ